MRYTDDNSLSLTALVDANEGDSTIFVGGALDDTYSGGDGDDVVLEWRERGWLALAYWHLVSLGNFAVLIE